MNRNIHHLSFVAASVLALVSCAKESQEKPDKEYVHGTLTAVLPETRTSIDMSQNVVWNSGDEIMVYSAACPLGLKYSTESDQETSGAFNPEGESVTGEKLYAVYPVAAANGSELSDESLDIDFAGLATQAYSSALDPTADITKVPMVAVSNGKKLVFSNLCGGMNFRIADWQDAGIMIKSIEIKANGGESLTGKGKVNLTDGTYSLSGGQSAVTLNFENGVSIGTGGHRDQAQSFIAFLPAGKYSKGFTFTITGTDGMVYTKSADGEISIAPGVVTPLKSLLLTVYYGKANCIRTATAGEVTLDITPYYSFAGDFTHTGISAEGKNPAVKAKIVWQHAISSGSGDIVGTPVISGNELKVPVKGTLGNALVAICDAADKVLWSYHIWVSESADVPYRNETAGEFWMMDRNLGALSTKLKDQNSYGCFYQWGRKDPFPRPVPVARPSAADKYKNADVELTPNTAATEETGTIGYTLSHPDTRLLDASTWHKAGMPDGLWGNPAGNEKGGKGAKTIYDPCPEGYRVADPMCYSMEWKKDKASCDANYGYDFITDGGSSKSTFATSGYLSTTSNGMEYLEYRGAVWTNAPVGGKGLRFYFNNASVKNNDGMPFTNGLPVRCVKETK